MSEIKDDISVIHFTCRLEKPILVAVTEPIN